MNPQLNEPSDLDANPRSSMNLTTDQTVPAERCRWAGRGDHPPRCGARALARSGRDWGRTGAAGVRDLADGDPGLDCRAARALLPRSELLLHAGQAAGRDLVSAPSLAADRGDTRGPNPHLRGYRGRVGLRAPSRRWCLPRQSLSIAGALSPGGRGERARRVRR